MPVTSGREGPATTYCRAVPDLAEHARRKQEARRARGEEPGEPRTGREARPRKPEKAKREEDSDKVH